MAKSFEKRIAKDINICMKSELYKFIPTDDSNIYNMSFSMNSGIYKDQVHVVQLKLTYGANKEYSFPRSAPLCTFITPIWHPNIGKVNSGIICVDKLKDEWSSLTSLDNIYSIIVLLLSSPNPDSPQNSEAAVELIENEESFITSANLYYTSNNGPEIAAKYS